MCLFRLFLVILTVKFIACNQTKSDSNTTVTSDPAPMIQQIHLRRMNGYFYSWLSTPNYPNKFTTPYNRLFVIDTQKLQHEFTGLPIIFVYLTELYVKSQAYVKFTDGKGAPVVQGVGSRAFSTPLDLLHILVNISDLYDEHVRTRDHFFHNFGFNISIEVVDNSTFNEPAESSCSIKKCSFAGKCRSFPGSERLEFRCDCMDGYSGRECENGPRCDPAKNINFCLNGGKCRYFGVTGLGECICPKEYNGTKCEVEVAQTNFIDGNKHCQLSPTGTNDRPCSLCRRINVPEDWHRYLMLLRNHETKEVYEGILSNVFYGQYSISSTTVIESSGTVLEIYGRRYNKTFVLPDGMSITKRDSIQKPRKAEPLSIYLMKPTIDVNKKKPLNEGEEFSLTCKAQLNVKASESFIDFKWYKDHVLINTSFTSRHISQHQSVHEQGKQMWSVLMIDYASPFDNGVFTCQVTDLSRNIQECTDFPMEVLVAPQLEVNPMSVTTVKNGSLILTCSDGTEEFRRPPKYESESKAFATFEWYMDDEPISSLMKNSKIFATTEDIYPQGKLLRIFRAQKSGILKCTANNTAGQSNRTISFKVLEGRMNRYDSCNEMWEDYTEFRMPWSHTSIGQTAMTKCPPGFKGHAQKNCIVGRNKLAKWTRTDFSRCTHAQLFNFNYTFHSIKSGFRLKEEGLHFLDVGLDKYLDFRRKNNSSMLLGEGDKFIEMLDEVWDYLNQLRKHSPILVEEKHIEGLISVADKFIGFQPSCLHNSTVFHFVRQLAFFVQSHRFEDYNGTYIFTKSFPLSINDTFSSSLEIPSKSIRLEFDYNPMNEVTKERWMTFTTLSDVDGLLHRDMHLEEIISEIVAVNIQNYTFKEDAYYEIDFDIKYTPRNISCAALNDFRWDYNSCKMNRSGETLVSCFCNRFGIFAVLALREDLDAQPKANKFISLPPNWIVTSGCFVCLVLCLKSLICSIYHKVYCSFFILSTLGIVISILSILHLILMYESRPVGILYMSVTLLIKSLRIWRMIWIYDMNEVFPWLEKVSRWILLAGVIMALLLPLWTVFVFDTAYSDQEFILNQNSPVFITFGVLITISVLAIYFVHYKTTLRIRRKSPSNNNNQGDQSALNENFCSTIIHLMQILCVALYLNLQQYIVLHYMLALSNCILGLTWRIPRNKSESKTVPPTPSHPHCTHQQQFDLDEIPPTRYRSASTFTDTFSFGNNKNIELKSLNSQDRRYASTIDDDEYDNDHETLQTSVSTISNHGTEGSSGYYAGSYPLKGKCYITFDDNYVLPSK